ncbi:MAG TPA: hypothetical protein VHH73_10845 [Verrucomicrobiae bacterium]|nr:hypothetical protein [Verrucomicrobiae bacterium]
MKLQQGQVWRKGDEYIRIVVLERLAVEYKTMQDLQTKEGRHNQVTKKQFCNLLKGASLLTNEELHTALGCPPKPF